MMKKILTTVFLVAVIACASQAQVFRYTYGALGQDIGEAVRQVHDLGFVVAGTTGSFGNGNSDVYLIKTAPDGDFLWSKTFGGSQVDQGMDIRQTLDSGLIITGYTNSFGSGGYDVYLIRTDSLGEVIWEKTYGGSDWDFGYKVTVLSDGGFLVIGDTYSYGSGNSDMYLIRTDENGDTLWTKTYGGAMEDFGRAAKVTDDGGFILAGGFSSTADDMDGYLVKVDAAGSLIWSNVFGGDSLDLARDVVQTLDLGYSAVGITESASEWTEMYHFRTDPSGGMMWANNWGQINDQEGFEMVLRADGGYVLGGYTKTSGGGGKDFFMQFHDANGGFESGRSFGETSDEEAFSLDTTNTGGYVLAGSTIGSGFGQKDVMVIRKDSSGGPGGKPAISIFDPLSVDEIYGAQGYEISVYPMPISDGAYIEVEHESFSIKEWSVEIFDIVGRPIWSQQAKGEGRVWFDPKGLSTGAYLYQIRTNGVTIGSGTMLLQP